MSLGAWEIGGAVRLTFEGLGTIPHGWGATDDAESVALLEQCADAGVNFLDTAPIYGNGHSEEVIGRGLVGCRDRWIVCTKGGHGATDGAAWSDFSKARLLAQMDESLARLRMDHVDLYLLHGPSAEDVRRGECLEAMETLRQQGKTRFVGVSIGPNALGVELIQRGVVDVLQQSISLTDAGAAADLLPAAVAGNVGIVARGVFGAGFLTGGVRPDDAFAADDRRSWQNEASKRALAAKAAGLSRESRITATGTGHPATAPSTRSATVGTVGRTTCSPGTRPASNATVSAKIGSSRLTSDPRLPGRTASSLASAGMP